MKIADEISAFMRPGERAGLFNPDVEVWTEIEVRVAIFEAMKEQDKITRHKCAEAAQRAAIEYIHEESVASVCEGVADVVHSACMNAR